MTLVDSSGWIEYFVDGPLADQFAPYLAEESELLTPTLVLFEVYRVIRRERTEEAALAAAAQIQRTRLVPLTATIALAAADLSLEHRLAMADALVYATARTHEAQLVTSDKDFDKLPGVIYFAKVKPEPKRRRRRRIVMN